VGMVRKRPRGLRWNRGHPQPGEDGSGDISMSNLLHLRIPALVRRLPLRRRLPILPLCGVSRSFA
jgi:hypothetical protein